MEKSEEIFEGSNNESSALEEAASKNNNEQYSRTIKRQSKVLAELSWKLVSVGMKIDPSLLMMAPMARLHFRA